MDKRLFVAAIYNMHIAQCVTLTYTLIADDEEAP